MLFLHNCSVYLVCICFLVLILTHTHSVPCRGHVTFDPPLPEYKQGAIKNLGFGTLNKVVLSFSDSFWTKAGTKYIGVYATCVLLLRLVVSRI